MHSGKTTLLKNTLSSLNTQNLAIDGYLSEAQWKKNEFLGYDLFDVKIHRSHPFIRKDGKEQWEKIGPFFFLPETMALAKKIIHRGQKADLCVVDEVGPLELEGKGVWPILKNSLILRTPDFLLVVRDSILNRFMEKIHTHDVVVYDIDEKTTPSRMAGCLWQKSEKRKI